MVAFAVTTIVVAALGAPASGQIAFDCSVTTNPNGTATITWNNIGANGYDVIEDNQPKRWITTTTTTDLSPGTNYKIVAFGNGTNWTTANCTNPNPGGGTTFDCSVTTNPNGTATITWNNIGANGYDVIEDNQPKRWITTTTTTDLSPGTNYKIVAFGNGTNWTTANCTNPNPGGGTTFDCSVTTNPNGTATITWNNIGANGYDVIEDNQPKRWITTTTTTDLSPGTNYKIVAFGNGTNWTTANCTNPNPGGPIPDPDPDPAGPVTLLATGDIAVCGDFHPPLVGAYVESRTDATFLALGDIAYPDGSAADFANCYDPSFADAKGRTLPVVGNHEYYTPGAAGYVDYFGAAAGPADKLYYSVDLGNWHIVVLNAECWRVGGCDRNSPQYNWLVNDLNSTDKTCVLAAWHHAYYTSEGDGDADWMKDFYQLLDDHGTDLLLTGHAHNYERFHRMNASGGVDANGIRNFVIGTGGSAQRGFGAIENGSVVRNRGSWGVVEFTLDEDSYNWNFVRTSGDPFTDSGWSRC